MAWHGPLANRNFRLFWFSLVLSNTGVWLQIVAQGWLMLELTDSAGFLGLMGFCRAVPLLALSPLAGVVVDRLELRRLLYVTQAIALLLAALLGTLTVVGAVRPWHILVITALDAANLAFDQPGRHTLVPSLVGEERLVSALSLNAAAFHGSAIGGPSLAGVLIHLIGISGCFLLNAASYLVFIVALAMLVVPPRRRQTAARSMRGELGAGVRHIFRQPMVVPLLTCSAALNTFGRAYQLLMPVFARDILRVGAQGLGFLMAAPGLGTVLAATLLSGSVGGKRRGPMVVGSMALFGGLVILFAGSRHLSFSLLALVGIGMLYNTFGSVTNALLQTSVSSEYRGRVLSFYTMSQMGLYQLGGLAIGLLADLIGAPVAVALGGASILVVLGGLMPQARRLWKVP
ncbi:MAG: MFS transporter [Deltaproteobacteria bacterium]|nr:MFS transporter [Deltaproteobacteria bacterium]